MIFVFYPVISMLVAAFQAIDGSFDPDGFVRNIQDPPSGASMRSGEATACGVAWRTFFLAIMTATGATAIGLCFALVATRNPLSLQTAFAHLTILPIITPPFVVGLALTLLFGGQAS